MNKLGKFNRHVKTCKNTIQNIHPKSVYILRDTLFDELNGFGISCKDDLKLVKILAIVALDPSAFPLKS